MKDLSIFKKITFSTLALLLLSQSSVAALSQSQIDVLRSGIFHFDTEQAVSCSSGDISGVDPGNGAPTGLTFPNLDPTAMVGAIDKFIAGRDHLPEYEGLGATIVASAKHSNINPFLIIGHGVKESSLGTDPKSTISKAPFFNTFGRTASDRQVTAGVGGDLGGRQWFKWSSIKTSVDYTDPYNKKDPAGTGDIASYIRSVYGDKIDTNDLTSYITKYAPPDENDTAGYIADIQKLMAEMAALSQGNATTTATPTPTTSTSSCAADCSAATNGGSTVVLDPGHAGAATTETDPATGIGAQEATNPTERKDMWDTAQIIKAKLEKDGYKVVLTKNSEDDPAGLLEKARRANEASAAIAVSLHSTAGKFGEPSKAPESWGVTPQEVGRFRENNDNGKKVTFTDAALATKSQQYAQVIAGERDKVGDKTHVVPLDASFPRSRTGILAWGDISIVQLFGKIPWVYNEAGQTGFDANKYAEGIANGIEKAVSLTGDGGATSDSGCSSGAVIGDAIATAKNYAWSDYRQSGSAGALEMKPAYRAAVDEARAKGVYVGGDPGYEGIDCGGFISLVMRNSGADPNYNEYKGPTSDQERYMKDHPEKYQALGSQNDTSALQPGDIAITSNHTYMYVGSKGFPGYNSVSASLDSRVPMASGADFIDSKGISFNWYRLIK